MYNKGLWDIVEEKNMPQGTREELALALSTTEGAALSPESLEPKIVELVKKLEPFVAMLNIAQANGKTHEFNKRTALPSAAFEGEKATTVASQSTYARAATALKILRNRGGVTGFQQAASKKLINSYAQELVGSAQAMAWLMAFGCLWGNATADSYQYNGLDSLITTNRLDKGATIQLSHLDDMINPIINVGITNVNEMVFLMSPYMHSKISTLASEVRKNLGKIQFPGGLEMETYRGIPILDSSFCRPSGTMGTVVATSSATAGSLVAGQTYRWKIAPVTQFGEQYASAEVAQVVGGGQSSMDLTFSAYTGALLYKVYRTVAAGGAGAEKLSKIVAAKTYDADGTVTGNVVAINDGIADGSLGTDVELVAGDADEVIFLANTNQEYSMEIASLLNEQGEKVKNLIQLLPLARVKDQEEFLLLSYQALIFKGEIFNAMIRRARAV